MATLELFTSESVTEGHPDDVHVGAANLRKQVENVRLHGISPVIAINAFPGDHASEHKAIAEVASELGVRVALCTHFADGGRGAAEFAEAVWDAAHEPSAFRLLYPDEAGLRDKIETVVTKVYGADGVDYDLKAARQLNGYGRRDSATCRCASPRPTCRSRRPGAHGQVVGLS